MSGMEASFVLALIGLATVLAVALPLLADGQDRAAKIACCVGAAFGSPLVLRLLVAAALS